MSDPNLRAMAKDIAKNQTSESYYANGWAPLVTCAHASSVIFDLGLNNNRGPNAFFNRPNAFFNRPSAEDMYWARAWVLCLAWLVVPEHRPAVIFNHVQEGRREELDDQFRLAYQESVESPKERLLTLTELSLHTNDAQEDRLKRAVQIDLDRTRREVRVAETSGLR